MQITENCVIDNMPEALYHSDPTPILEGFAQSASFSSSMAKAMVEKTEKEAFLSNQRLNPDFEEDEGSDSTDVGTIAHDYVLRNGMGNKVYEVAQVKDWKTNDAKEIKRHILDRGLIPLNLTTAERHLGAVLDMHKALHEQLAAHRDYPGLMMKGKGERSAFVKHGPIWLRARFDWEDDNYPDLIVDYKTTGLSFDSWEKNQLWGTDGAAYLQEAHYRLVKSTLTGKPCTFVFVVQQTFAPYLVKIIQIDESFRDDVTGRYDLAKRKFVNCLKTGVWRGHPPYTGHSAPPPWITNKWVNDSLEHDMVVHREQEEQKADAAPDVTMAG